MECPRCRLLNPPEAERCDCGYDFKTGEIKSSYLTERDTRWLRRRISWVPIIGFLVMITSLRFLRSARGNITWFGLLIGVAIAVAGFWLWKRRARR